MPSLLDGIHEAVKMGAERLQAGGIQEETALAGGMRRGARRRAALLREGNLLVLAEKDDFLVREAELRVGDGARGRHVWTSWLDTAGLHTHTDTQTAHATRRRREQRPAALAPG